jgi:fructose-1,6-bisphosphatase/inositol monophosphatase family enzyme
MKPDIRQVETIIREVAQTHVIPHWRNLKASDISTKTGPTDIVTIADRACEKALCERLTAAYPGTHVVGEESVSANADKLKLFESGELVWVIDPIDGTTAFSEGREEFDVMLALVKGTELLAGWIYAPIRNIFFLGEKGGGVEKMEDGQSLRLPPVADLPLKELTGILGRKSFAEMERNRLKAQEISFKGLINSVCAGHDYSRLLGGGAQFAAYAASKPWDHLPGLALAQELGFAFAKHDGRDYMDRLDWQGGILVTPQAQWKDIQRVLFG